MVPSFFVAVKQFLQYSLHVFILMLYFLYMEHYKRVTLEDISREIGISRTTIYKVINNKEGVAGRTKEKVLSALESLGYRPNQAAKTLALNRVLPVGFVGFHSDRSPHFSTSIRAGLTDAENELHDYGLHLDIDISDYREPEKQLSALETMGKRGVRGVLIVPNDIGKPSIVPELKNKIRRLTAEGIYVITINRDIPDSNRHWYVGCDYVKSGLLAAEILGKMTKQGRVLPLIAGSPDNGFIDARARLEGFYKKMKEFRHLEITPPFFEEAETRPLAEYVEEQLRDPGLTGIFDITYKLDHISRLVRKQGNRVKVVGFDLSKSIQQNMLEHLIDAVVFQNMHTQGYQAVKSLFSVLSGNDYPRGDIITKLEVVFEENLSYYL